MRYVIDGNNLAGKMDLLKEKEWQKELIYTLREYFAHSKKEIILVFDSNDPWGDKYPLSPLTVIHAPRDQYYRSADDKILELIEQAEKERELVVITDDLEIGRASCRERV